MLINSDTVTCLTEKELDKVINAFIARDGCFEAYDTLLVGYNAYDSANVKLEGINTILTNDLEVSKVLTQSCEAEKIEVEKQLKKKVRQNKFKEALLWTVSGVAAAAMILYLVK